MSRPVVFVAGASSEPERVRWAMDAVEREGWFLALDWLATIEGAGTACEGLTRAARRAYAEIDAMALHDSDVMWLLASPKTRGGWVELGLALAWRIPVVSTGADSLRCIYGAGLEGVSVIERLSDAEGLDVLRRVIDDEV